MSRPWMPLYVADYLADTGHLSTVEHGAYMLLIMHYWQKGGLPDDDKRLASIARASTEQWADIRGTLAEFFAAGWKHERIDDELEKSAKAYERRAAAGKAGGTAKAQKASIATAKPEQSLSQSQTEKEEPNGSSKKRATTLADDFEPDLVWAVAQGLTLSEAQIEAAQFKDFWRTKTGKEALKAEWPAAWRMWIRNYRKRRPTTRSPPKVTSANMWIAEGRQLGILDDPASQPDRRLEDRLARGPDQGSNFARRIASS